MWTQKLSRRERFKKCVFKKNLSGDVKVVWGGGEADWQGVWRRLWQCLRRKERRMMITGMVSEDFKMVLINGVKKFTDDYHNGSRNSLARSGSVSFEVK